MIEAAPAMVVPAVDRVEQIPALRPSTALGTLHDVRYSTICEKLLEFRLIGVGHAVRALGKPQGPGGVGAALLVGGEGDDDAVRWLGG